MTRRLQTSYLLLAAFILLVVALPLGITYTKRAEDRLLSDVERDARVMAGLVEERVEASDTSGVSTVTERYAAQTSGRVVVVDSAGISLSDTSQSGTTPRDFSTRPEFKEALSGTQSSGIRPSDTLDDEIAYVAVPIASGSSVKGAVRVTFSTDDLREQVRDYWLRLGLLIALVLGLAGALGWLMSRWAIAPIAMLEAGAEQLATGDLSGRISIESGPPELRDLGRTFNVMAGRLESLVNSQRAFVADASHQLRTPLTAMRLRLESLEDELAGGNNDAAQTELDAVTEETERLGRLVEGLLAIVSGETRGAATVAVDVAALADDAVERWGALAAERSVQLQRTGVESARAISLSGALEQVFDNLIDNALEVSPPGSAIEIDVENLSPQRSVRLSIRDHGPGMSAEERERATDRFWRGPTSAPTGTGLGLAIVKQLAEGSGGTIDLCAPAHGGGLEVVVMLNAARPVS
jgi:signal transduction histidine kinase